MRNLAILFLAAVLVAVAGLAPAATTSGTVTVNTSTVGEWTLVTWTWTSDSGGNVIDNTASAYGYLERVTFDPGSTAPTDNYDVDIQDATGVNILFGLGDNRDTANSESLIFGQTGAFSTSTLTQAVDTDQDFYPWLVPVHGVLTLTISNAGDTKGGSISALFRNP